jgi:LAO/AO transport system kinase
MGDDIQAMKAGIMEIADIIVLNKSDLEGATTCLRHLEAVLSVAAESQSGWKPKIVPTVSVASKAENLRGIDELVQTIGEHQHYLRSSREIDQATFSRVEHELGLIFKDELQKIIFKGLRGTGKKKKYIQSIMDRKNDPYSVVEEVLTTYLLGEK